MGERGQVERVEDRSGSGEDREGRERGDNREERTYGVGREGREHGGERTGG